MATLSTLVSGKRENLGAAPEQNLETGEIYVFTSAGTTANMRCKFCWVAPAAGRITVEIWGAAGSGGRMCCCGGGVPGNAPAYSKKTQIIGTGTYICGCVGYACGNSDALCFRGCSTGTCITICDTSLGASGCSCMCAMGARGGRTHCHESGGSAMCCLGNNGGLCISATGTGCGWVCNISSGYTLGQAYGGNVNCPERVSCTCFGSCNSQSRNLVAHYLATPPGIYSTDGGYIQLQEECANGYQVSPGPAYGLYAGLAGAGRQPVIGQFPSACWSSIRYCQCYEFMGCYNFMPPAIPGISSTPCSSVRDHGTRGGNGLVRIKYTSN